MAENGVGRAASGPRPVVVVVVEAAAAAGGRRSKAGGGKGGKGGKGSIGGGGPTAAQLPGSAAGRARRQARRCGAGCVWYVMCVCVCGAFREGLWRARDVLVCSARRWRVSPAGSEGKGGGRAGGQRDIEDLERRKGLGLTLQGRRGKRRALARRGGRRPGRRRSTKWSTYCRVALTHEKSLAAFIAATCSPRIAAVSG